MSPAKRDVAELPLYATYADNHKMYMTKNAIEVEGRCCLVRPDRKPWFAVNENLHQAVYLSLQSTTNLRMCALKRHNATAKPHKTIFKNEKKTKQAVRRPRQFSLSSQQDIVLDCKLTLAERVDRRSNMYMNCSQKNK